MTYMLSEEEYAALKNKADEVEKAANFKVKEQVKARTDELYKKMVETLKKFGVRGDTCPMK